MGDCEGCELGYDSLKDQGSRDGAGVGFTTRALIAISRLPSIQNAHVANQRFPSKAASGRTFSSRKLRRMGPLSPS